MRKNLVKHLFAATLALSPIVVFVKSSLSTTTAWSQDFTQNNQAENLSKVNLVDLESQLVSGLRLTSAGQKQYIAAVMAQVQAARIPRSMVNVVFRWSLERNPRYPFPYFRIAMNTLASRRGVSLP
jgi:hypothetical protein